MSGECITNRVVDLIPPTIQGIFDFQTFNSMQMAILPSALNTNENMVIAAPTGSGKTVIHELAIARLFLLNIGNGGSMRCVYIAPNKALCQQRWAEWKSKFGNILNLSVLEVTGDTDFQECLRNVAKASIIITTPEKWDSLTRSWRDHIYLLGRVDLLLIDEIHHLNDDRGAVLETVIVRMRFITQTCATKSRTNEDNSSRRMRIVALSATLPNISDIGEWLGCTPENVHYFDEGYRPVPLSVLTIPYGSMKNQFLFEKSLDNRVKEVIVRYSQGKQTLIFCSSKNSTQTLTEKLFQQNATIRPTINSEIESLVNRLQDETLKNFTRHGYAYHHAGLPVDDRSIVERLFIIGFIRILSSTSTLAHGVNLPAYLVIIKGTYSWRGSGRGYEKLGRSDIIQMLGRAGRPGFDTNGMAVIMTSREDQAYYSDITLSADVVDSKLPNILPEAITAEISQKVITDLSECVQWMLSTYFYVRAKNTNKVAAVDSNQLKSFVESKCKAALQHLSEGKLIQYDEITNTIVPNIEANIMTKNLTRCKSMLKLMALPCQTDMKQLLEIISSCEELHKPVRKLEKRILNELKSNIRFADSKKTITEPSQKCYLLLQMAVNNHQRTLKDFTLRVEQAELVDSGLRLLRSVQELSISKGYGMLLRSAILLERAFRSRLWEWKNSNIYYQCEHFLTEKCLITLEEQSYHTLIQLYGYNVQQLMHMLPCSANDAKGLYDFIQLLSQTKLIFSMTQEDLYTLKIVILPDVSLLPTIDSSSLSSSSAAIQQYPYLPTTSSLSHPVIDLHIPIYYQLICYDSKSGNLLCHRKLPMGTKDITYTVPFPADQYHIEDVNCYLYANIVGIDYVEESTSSATSKTPADQTNNNDDIRSNNPIRQAQIDHTILTSSKKTTASSRANNKKPPPVAATLLTSTSKPEDHQNDNNYNNPQHHVNVVSADSNENNSSYDFMPSALEESFVGSIKHENKNTSTNIMKTQLDGDILCSTKLMSRPSTGHSTQQSFQTTNAKAVLLSRRIPNLPTITQPSKRFKLEENEKKEPSSEQQQQQQHQHNRIDNYFNTPITVAPIIAPLLPPSSSQQPSVVSKEWGRSTTSISKTTDSFFDLVPEVFDYYSKDTQPNNRNNAVDFSRFAFNPSSAEEDDRCSIMPLPRNEKPKRATPQEVKDTETISQLQAVQAEIAQLKAAYDALQQELKGVVSTSEDALLRTTPQPAQAYHQSYSRPVTPEHSPVVVAKEPPIIDLVADNSEPTTPVSSVEETTIPAVTTTPAPYNIPSKPNSSHLSNSLLSSDGKTTVESSTVTTPTPIITKQSLELDFDAAFSFF